MTYTVCIKAFKRGAGLGYRLMVSTLLLVLLKTVSYAANLVARLEGINFTASYTYGWMLARVP